MQNSDCNARIVDVFLFFSFFFFYSEWLLMYGHSKTPLCNLAFWIEENECVSNFAHRLLFKVQIESLHSNLHQRETSNQHFSKKNSKELAKLDLEFLLLVFIYYNSKFEVFCKKQTLNAGLTALIPKRSQLVFLSDKILKLND